MRNFSVAVRQWQDEIVFLHKLIPGGANRSYGIEVARLAGLPKTVLLRSKEILQALESAQDQSGTTALPIHGVPPLQSRQLSLFLGQPLPEQAGDATATPLPAPLQIRRSPVEDEVLRSLRALEPDELSPRAAHTALTELLVRLRQA